MSYSIQVRLVFFSSNNVLYQLHQHYHKTMASKGYTVTLNFERGINSLMCIGEAKNVSTS